MDVEFYLGHVVVASEWISTACLPPSAGAETAAKVLCRANVLDRFSANLIPSRYPSWLVYPRMTRRMRREETSSFHPKQVSLGLVAYFMYV